MASYQNTSGYYCGINMNTYSGHCPNPNAYFNQNPTNFYTHASACNPDYTGAVPTYNPTHVYGHVPQYSTIQNTPLTQEPVIYPVFHQEPRPHINQYMGRKHHAQITILPSSRGTFKAQIKRKRKRTMFTTEQVAALEDLFKAKQYVSREDRLVIGTQLEINDKAVKTWFQNRRLKGKRQQSHNSEEETENTIAEDLQTQRNSQFTAVLDSIESDISKKTDENGNVSLDDGLMRDLVNVIDAVLTKNKSEVPLKEVVGSDSLSPYEPISPASVSDTNEEVSSVNWITSEPKESLQRLFDLQSLLLL